MEIEDINDDLPTSSAAPWTKPESNPEPEVIEEQNKDKVNENKKSPIKEQKPAVSGIGNDEIQDWLLNIVEVFNQEYVRRYERGEISDKNPIIVKGPRDLEDGFVIGLAVRAHCPNLVAPHNIPRTFNRKQKLENWSFLNERVFSKIGFRIEDKLINDIVEHDKQRSIDFFLMLKNLLERDYPQVSLKKNTSRSTFFLFFKPGQ